MRFKNSLFKSASFFVLWVFILSITSSGVAQVSGTVFRDFNANGIKDSNEPLVSGVTINAYLANATSPCGTTISSGSSAPNYTLMGCGTAPVRIEFVLPSAGNCVQAGIDYPAFKGSSNGTSIQFVNGNSTNVNFAVMNPADYNAGAASVDVMYPTYVNGDPLPVSSLAGAEKWFIGTDYNDVSISTVGTPDRIVNGAFIGACWGVAYSKQADKVFTSAFVKRHVGLGVNGSGAIYMLTPSGGTFTASSFYNLDANGHRTRAASGTYGENASFTINGSNSVLTFLGATDPLTGKPNGLGVLGSNAERGLPTDPIVPNYDPAAHEQVGKVGLGGLEISDDGRFLYVMNLYSRRVFQLELNDAANPTSVVSVVSYAIPDPGCNLGTYRPFALKFYRNKLYIGVVCSAENGGSSNDLGAFVYEMTNPTGSAVINTTPVINFALNYNRSGDTDWKPWFNDANQTTENSPILSDIDFSDRGDLIMGFMARNGHQFGYRNRQYLKNSTNSFNSSTEGEILIAGVDCAGAFNLENNGSFSSNGTVISQTHNSGATQGIGGQEFFNDDAPTGDPHDETAIGSLAHLKGSGEVFLASFAISNSIPADGGTMRLSTNDGNYISNSGFVLYSAPGTTNPTFPGKANGLGDVELLMPLSPIEIGNRVWHDTNKNGVQDAGEAGIAGVTLQLSKFNGTSYTNIATCTTDANGNYYFSSAAGTSGTGATYNVTNLTSNSQFKISIPTVYNNLMLTAMNIASISNSDEIDSDADGFGTISFTSGNAGENNHSYDIGYQTPTEICTGEEYTLSVPAGTTGQWYKDGVAIPSATGISYVVTTPGNYYFIGSGPSGCVFSSCTNSAFIAGTCGSVGNYVWNDSDADGIQDVGETGINGITVELYQETSAGSGTYTLAQTTTTATNAGNLGFYNFILHQSANYYVHFPTATASMILSPQTVAAATDGNSDANTSTGNSPIFAINVNGTSTSKDNPTIDAGFMVCTLTASIAKSNDLSCLTPNATLTASPATGVTYLWDNGSTGATRTVSTAGTYSVTVMDMVNGCTDGANVTVTSTISTPPCAPMTIQKTK